MSFLQLENRHVFVTGAGGGIGKAIVAECLRQGCRVSAHDLRPIDLEPSANLYCLKGDISEETSIASSIAEAKAHFGPIHVLCANAGITDESAEYPLWELPSDVWDRIYAVNTRGTFLTIKHFLASAVQSQKEQESEMDLLSIVVTGSECGKFGQAGHAEYASGKAGLQYGLVRTVKNEIVKMNSRARINAVAPGWVNTPLIEGRLDDPKEMYLEAQATVPLRKIAKAEDVANTVVFLASERASHISGECLSVDGGMEGRIIWKEEEVLGSKASRPSEMPRAPTVAPSKPTVSPIKILISVDFDAVSGWLGTGTNPKNNMADYSAGFFSGLVGVPRLLKLFKKLKIADKVSWFIPGHSAESFPEQTKAIVETGCEIGLHGYCHEGAPQLTEMQQREVLEKSIEVATKLTGKKPVGYRAPLYQIDRSTINLLEEHGFLYDSSLTHHDSKMFWLPDVPVKAPSYRPEASAKEWMHPLPQPGKPSKSTLVEIPANWYSEDMTPMQFWPYTDNSSGYVPTRVMEQMWIDKFEFMRGEQLEEHEEGRDDMFVFSLTIHPDTSGMAHVIGMLERFIRWLQIKGDEVEFMTFGEAAAQWKASSPTNPW